MIDYLRLGTPLPAKVRLAAEVSDRTLRRDLGTKKTQYGQAGIPEYWVVSINARTLHVFRRPIEAGCAAETIFTPDDTSSPLAAPDTIIRAGHYYCGRRPAALSRAGQGFNAKRRKSASPSR